MQNEFQSYLVEFYNKLFNEEIIDNALKLKESLTPVLQAQLQEYLGSQLKNLMANIQAGNSKGVAGACDNIEEYSINNMCIAFLVGAYIQSKNPNFYNNPNSLLDFPKPESDLLQ